MKIELGARNGIGVSEDILHKTVVGEQRENRRVCYYDNRGKKSISSTQRSEERISRSKTRFGIDEKKGSDGKDR